MNKCIQLFAQLVINFKMAIFLIASAAFVFLLAVPSIRAAALGLTTYRPPIMGRLDVALVAVVVLIFPLYFKEIIKPDTDEAESKLIRAGMVILFIIALGLALLLLGGTFNMFLSDALKVLGSST